MPDDDDDIAQRREPLPVHEFIRRAREKLHDALGIAHDVEATMTHARLARDRCLIDPNRAHRKQWMELVDEVRTQVKALLANFDVSDLDRTRFQGWLQIEGALLDQFNRDPVDDDYKPLTREEREDGVRGEFPPAGNMIGWVRRWEATVRAAETRLDLAIAAFVIECLIDGESAGQMSFVGPGDPDDQAAIAGMRSQALKSFLTRVTRIDALDAGMVHELHESAGWMLNAILTEAEKGRYTLGPPWVLVLQLAAKRFTRDAE